MGVAILNKFDGRMVRKYGDYIMSVFKEGEVTTQIFLSYQGENKEEFLRRIKPELNRLGVENTLDYSSKEDK